jgi:hypothetical protein
MSTNEARPARRWFWYALAGIVLTALAAAVTVVVSYNAWHQRRQAQQKAAVAAVERLGGETQQWFSSWLNMLTYFERNDAPSIIFLNSKNLTDHDLKIFESAPTTRVLHLFDNQITDAGLVHLKDLKSLEMLDLRKNGAVTDAGLVHLEGLTKLEKLWLIGTSVTPAGVAKLQKKLPKTKIAH